MTVEHLRSMQRQRMSGERHAPVLLVSYTFSVPTPWLVSCTSNFNSLCIFFFCPNVCLFTALPSGHENLIQRYRQGYNECASEVTSYLMSCPNMDSALRLRILAHLEVRCRSTNQLLQLKSEAATKARAHQLPYPLPLPSSHGNQYTSERVARGTLCAPPNEVKTSDGWESGSSQRIYAPVTLPFQTSAAFGNPFSDQISTFIPAFRSSTDGHQSQRQSGSQPQPDLSSVKHGQTELSQWIPMTPPDSATSFQLTPYGHCIPYNFPKGILQGEDVWRPW